MCLNLSEYSSPSREWPSLGDLSASSTPGAPCAFSAPSQSHRKHQFKALWPCGLHPEKKSLSERYLDFLKTNSHALVWFSRGFLFYKFQPAAYHHSTHLPSAGLAKFLPHFFLAPPWVAHGLYLVKKGFPLLLLHPKAGLLLEVEWVEKRKICFSQSQKMPNILKWKTSANSVSQFMRRVADTD